MAKKILIFIVAALLVVSAAFAQNSKESVFLKFKEKYGSMKSAVIDFSLEENTEMSGKLKAKKGDKYSLETTERIIVCDGETIWNYSKKDNLLLVSGFTKYDEKSVSIENFFFDAMENYEPISLSAASSSRGERGYLLKIRPKENSAVYGEIESIALTLDKNDFSPLNILTEGKRGKMTWDVKKFVANPKLPDSEFEFEAPKDAQVIEMK